MSTSPYTLGAFFASEGKPYLKNQNLEPSASIEGLKRALAEKTRGLSWSTVAGALEAKLAQVLDVDVTTLMLTAWKKAMTIEDQLRKSAASPEETFLLHLAEHTLSSSHNPGLEIYFEGILVRRLEVEVALELTIEGATLKIEAGSIREVKLGDVQGEGRLALEGVPLIAEKTKSIELPGTLRLTPEPVDSQPAPMAPVAPVAEHEASALSRISLH